MSAVAAAVALRGLTRADRARVEAITRATGLFRPAELPIALEVFDGAVGGSPDYQALGATRGGALAGWIAWGPTPCTLGTYDLYWLAVDPAMHRVGIGAALVHAMERQLAGVARLVVVETAGRPEYAGTRAFYDALGYHAVAVIPEFYAPDDDQVVLAKSLTLSPSSKEDR